MPTILVCELTFSKLDSVICVDDSISIFHGWNERFKSIDSSEINLRYCKSKEELLLELDRKENQRKTYFVDYEFSGKSYTGLDLAALILKNKPQLVKIFLVTSRSAESHIQQFCEKNNIQMIPKHFAFKIPLRTF